MSKINLDFEKINDVLNNGGVIAFVTDTVWGLGCLPDNKKGADKIYKIKGRDRTKPLILMSNETEKLIPYTKNLSNKAKEFIKQYFPGALTVITEKSDLTPGFITAGKNTIGIRVPDNELFKTLCSGINAHVLATTSANLSNEPSGKTYEQVLKSMSGRADIILDDFGYKCAGLESTVILALSDEIKILRQGSVFFNQDIFC